MSKDSKFVEYWVPVGFSGVQLEQYCANLVCNHSSLSNPSKIDYVGSLQCVLDTARKCCDHPYVVDSTLQKSLVTVVDEKVFLEVGINASGKLKLLDLMLADIKNKGLKVLVLFQSDLGPCNAGDIVDDVIRLRFGNDCYERFHGTVQPSKRLASLNKFNTQEGSFIFLLEVQSCSSKIKLCNIDCVIVYGSDWNPMNDMKSLQKILIDSKAEKIPVFRLFSPFTVEEKALSLSRQDFSLDVKVKNFNVSANHMLLMWGSSILYDKLFDFNASDKSENTLFGQFQPENIVQEFSAIMDQNGKGFQLNESSTIVKVEKMDYYVTGSNLPGEKQVMLKDDEPPHIFWKRLLSGKQPLWRYKFSFTSEKKRKRGQLLALELSTDIRISNEEGETPPAKRCFETNEGQDKSPSPTITNNSEKEPESENLYELQKNLHNRSKPEIFKLCDVLKLPENVKFMVDNFLDYVMANHRMTVASATIIEAFQISLCWTVAFFTKFDLNHKRSLSLARQHLNYSCRKDDTEDIFLMLKCLKRVFLSHMQNSPAEVSGLHSDLNQKDLSDAIQDINHIFSKKVSKLSKKKLNERNNVVSNYGDEKKKLAIKRGAEESIIKVTSKDEMNSSLNEAVEETYGKTFWELEEELMNRLKQVEEVHQTAVDRVKNRKRDLIEGLTKWTKLQPEVTNFTPKAEILKSGFDILPPPLTKIRQQKDMNSAAEIGENRRFLNESESHAHNNMDIDVKPIKEVSSEPTTNCNLTNIGSPQADNANSFPQNTEIEEPVFTSNPPNLSSSHRQLTTSPESAYVGVTNEGISSLPGSGAVEPRKDPISASTSIDNHLNLGFTKEVHASIQGNTRFIEPSKSPTSANTVNNSLSTLRFSQGIEVISPKCIFAEDTRKSVPSVPPSSSVVEPREEANSAANTNANAPYLMSSQASYANEPEATGFGASLPSTCADFKSTKASPQVGYSEENGANFLYLTSVVIANEVLPNGDKDVDQEPSKAPMIDPLHEVNVRTADEPSSLHHTNNQMVAPNGFTDSIETNSPKDILVDNETNDASANDHPSVRDVITERPPDTNINPIVYQLDPFFDGLSFPLSQINEEHLLRPSNASFDFPVRLGISANGSQNHNAESHSVRRKPSVSPLHIELDNILKEKERVIQTNEDNKMRVRAECEEELLKIRRKYEAMLTEAELQTLEKRRELNMNYEKVKLSMLIADAFKAKTSRSRPPKNVARSDEADPMQPLPHGVSPVLPRGYQSPWPNAGFPPLLQRSDSNVRCSDPMNDANCGKNVVNTDAVQPVEVGDIVYVSDDD